jgi:uncharacterized membrane protein
LGAVCSAYHFKGGEVTKKILYGVGLLIVYLMVLGLAINYIGKWVGVAHPLDSWSILIVFWFSALMFLGINKKRIYNWIKTWNFKSIPKSIYVLILLPIMAVAGAELVNYTNSNVMLMIMLPLIVVVPLVCMFTKLIPKKYWAFTIWMMALAVILHRALITPYLFGSDNIYELSCFRAVYGSGVFPTQSIISSGVYSTVLSITILPTMISRITGISGVWVFKLVFPLMLSVVPVAVYELVKSQFKENIALLSSFLVMSVYTFFTVMLMTDKQLIATVLFAIFFLMLFDNVKNKVYLLALLGLGVILAHYGTAILFIILLVGVAIILRKKSYIIMTVLLAIITFVWYKSQGNGEAVSAVVWLGQTTITSSNNGIGNIVSRLMHFGSTYLPPEVLILYGLSQIAIVIGFITVVWHKFIKKDFDVKMEYLTVAFIFLALLGLELVIPKLSSYFGVERIYLYAMMILALFMFVAITKFKWWGIVSVIFVGAFFLLNVGFINQLQGKPLSNSIALSPNTCDFPIFTSNELDGAKWAINTDQPIYGDNYSRFIFYYLNVPGIWERMESNVLEFRLNGNNAVVTNNVPVGSYIYLRKYNLESNELTLLYYQQPIQGTMEFPVNSLGDFKTVIYSAKIIYQNSDCEILQTTVGYDGN